MVDSVGSFFSKARSTVSEAADSVGSGVKGAACAVGSGMKDAVNVVGNSAKDVSGTVGNEIKEKAMLAKSRIQDAFRSELQQFQQYCVLEGISKFAYSAKCYQNPGERAKIQDVLSDFKESMDGEDKIILLDKIFITDFEKWAQLKAELFLDLQAKIKAAEAGEKKKWEFGDNLKKLKQAIVKDPFVDSKQ